MLIINKSSHIFAEIIIIIIGMLVCSLSTLAWSTNLNFEVYRLKSELNTFPTNSHCTSATSGWVTVAMGVRSSNKYLNFWEYCGICLKIFREYPQFGSSIG